MQTRPFASIVPAPAAERLLMFRESLSRMLPGLVHDIVLFGSRARGDAAADSDYDVAVLLAGGLSEDRQVRRRIADLAWEHVIDGYAIVPVVLEANSLGDVAGEVSHELVARIFVEGVRVA